MTKRDPGQLTRGRETQASGHLFVAGIRLTSKTENLSFVVCQLVGSLSCCACEMAEEGLNMCDHITSTDEGMIVGVGDQNGSWGWLVACPMPLGFASLYFQISAGSDKHIDLDKRPDHRSLTTLQFQSLGFKTLFLATLPLYCKRKSDFFFSQPHIGSLRLVSHATCKGWLALRPDGVCWPPAAAEISATASPSHHSPALPCAKPRPVPPLPPTIR